MWWLCGCRVWRRVILARRSIVQDEADLDDPRYPSSHQRVAEQSVNHGRKHELLGVARHCPPCDYNDDAWENGTSAFARGPNTHCTTKEPHYAHGSMLKILVRPWSTLMLRECIHQSPQADDPAIEPFLRLASSCEPPSSCLHHDEQDDRVGNERRAHDVMCKTLSQMTAIAPRVAPGSISGQFLLWDWRFCRGDFRRESPLARNHYERWGKLFKTSCSSSPNFSSFNLNNQSVIS